MDAISGKKSEAQTFSGTEPVMFILWDFASNYSPDLEIHQLPLDALQQKQPSQQPLTTTGQEHSSLNQTTDKRIQQLFTLFLPSMFTH